jgi:hypothetical protein
VIACKKEYGTESNVKDDKFVLPKKKEEEE